MLPGGWHRHAEVINRHTDLSAHRRQYTSMLAHHGRRIPHLHLTGFDWTWLARVLIDLSQHILCLRAQLRALLNQMHAWHVVVDRGPRRFKPDFICPHQLSDNSTLMQVVSKPMHAMDKNSRLLAYTKRPIKIFPREAIQCRLSRHVLDLDPFDVQSQPLKVSGPGTYRPCIAQAFRMIAMPVRFAIGLLAVISKQDDSPGTEERCQRYRASSRI